MSEIDTLTKEKQSTDLVVLKPSKYKVIIYNDNTTPVEFVVALLVTVFRHNEPSAISITMQVHHDGSGIAGLYTYEIAEQKGIEITLEARGQGFPLQIKLDPDVG